MRSLLLATAVLSAACLPAVADDELPGYDRFAVDAAHRAQLVAASIWYPTGRATYRGVVGGNALFIGTEAYIGAAVADGPHPLVLLSHGSGGNMDTLGWLASGLARAGIMVLAVNHPGSTTGDSSPRRSIRVWERPSDLSAALDQLLADPLLAGYVDADRIYSLGFSLGGLTALQLVGVTADLETYHAYCDERGEASEDCLFFAKGGVDFAKVPADDFGADRRDPRVRGAIAVEPGFSYAFTDASLEAATMPIQLFNLGKGEDRWPAADLGPDGSNLVGRLANVDYVELAPAAHLTFLARCTDAAPAILAEAGDDAICDDPPGTDRGAIHDAIVEAAAGFILR